MSLLERNNWVRGPFLKRGSCSFPEGETECAPVKVPQRVSVVEKEREGSKGLWACSQVQPQKLEITGRSQAPEWETALYTTLSRNIQF